MVALPDYVGREQSYVKHIFLESYLERLIHKTASKFSHIVYVDGFAGPWQSANERFEDTSFGIALNALRSAKSSWRPKRDVRMSAHLVERNATAYERLAQIPALYPDLSITTYKSDFIAVLPKILAAIPSDAFAFFLVDPKGWRIPLQALKRMLARSLSEISFNFMFDFINRAASMKEPIVVNGLNELIPFGNWRTELEETERNGSSTPDTRKAILTKAFAACLTELGNYQYVAETTVLKPLDDRPLYCLFYATRHKTGIEVFRDSQVRALSEQSKTRATVKLKHSSNKTGQGELFGSMNDMGPAELDAFLIAQKKEAESSILELTPKHPDFVRYDQLWPKILVRHVVRVTDINSIAARLRNEGALVFPDWEQGKRVPQPHYRTQRSGA